ncbi:MAG: autotransporter outer membrane beta-barrel domain-containing protein [Phascolarctobacterium sp.]|nr:autotransporter outer membrane beta-barrel domain-containing protein [Phascolarctobacterium sp.]
MSKKMMKHSLALGALMAFVITGSAMAAELTDVNVVREDSSTDTSKLIALNTGEYAEALTFKGDNLSISVNNKVSSEETFGFYDLPCKYENVLGVEGVTKKIEVNADAIQAVRAVELGGYGGSGSLTVNADEFIIKTHSEENMSRALNLRSGYNLTINADKTTIVATSGENGLSLGIGAFSGSTLNVKGDLAIVADYAIAVSGGASVKINESGNDTVQINGLVSFHRTGGNEIDSVLELNISGEDSYLNGNIIAEDDRHDDPTSVVNGMKFSLSDKAQWTTDDASFVNNLELNDGVINVVGGSEGSVSVDNITGTGGTICVDNATEGQFVVGAKGTDTEGNDTKLTVSTNNQDLELSELVGVVATAETDASGNVTSYTNAADYVEKTGGDVYSSEKYEVNDDGSLGESFNVVDSANVSVNDMAAIGLMSWRAEMNDMNKRMGELRNANGEHGVWVRMVRGESEYNSVKNQYNQYQLGYDEKLSTDPSWTVGVALSYTDAENNFAQGNGESTNKALSIYGSKLNEDGTFIDLIAKYARLENDFTTYSGMGAADYDANGYSFSAEFGKRIQQGKGLWIEPQVELTYGKVGSANYVTENGVNVAQDSMDSIVGRIGFSLGKDIKDGNVYARASYLYDFDGETKAVLNGVETLENDLGGGWWEVGVGANINLSKATYIYADVEKTFGGEVDTNWQWNLGVRYSF